MQRAVFLDRDGVIVEDEGPDAGFGELRLLYGVPEALLRLSRSGFALIVVTNQPVIARGLAREEEVEAVNAALARKITQSGGPELRHFYYCPHHPNANVARYRVDCECRKPRDGMLRRAAEENGLDLTRSFMIGDRISDVVAGTLAGCRTVLIESGRHLDDPIQSSLPMPEDIRAEFVCPSLAAATEWIVSR